MLRHIFRRLLWIFPSALGISLFTFYLLSLLPARDASVHSPHARYRELPLFFNPAPRDIRTRVTAAIRDTVEEAHASPRATTARAELVRLGGAALPLIIPELDALAPDARIRLALALAPLAARMRLDGAARAADPKAVVRFWSRFWESSEVEFRPAAAKSAARRYAQFGTTARERELMVLDTYALPAIMDTLPRTTDASTLEPVRRLVGVLAHVTAIDDRLGPEAGVDEARACVERWRRWWLAHRAELVQLAGSDRLGAFALETRYGKWALEALSTLGNSDVEGSALWTDFIRRARVTVAVLGLGWVGAYLIALPLAAIAAARRSGRLDRSLCWLIVALHATSAAALGVAWAHIFAPQSSQLLAAGIVIALSLACSPLLQQRVQSTAALHEEWTRAAAARGASPFRIAIHGLRGSMLPVIAQASLELPTMLTACFVVEHAFGLRGLGEATLRAVREGNVSWLMALSVCGVSWGIVALVASDVISALVDPRTRAALVRLGARS